MIHRLPVGFAVVSALNTLLITTPSLGRDLTDLIPGLYGGDGIQLARSSEGAPAHPNVFEVDSAAQINRFNQEISGEIRPFPVSPSAGGITYEFDPETGTYRQTTDSLGPIVAERPQTLGKGKFSINVAFTSFEYDEFEGDKLDDLTATARHMDVSPAGLGDPTFELDEIAIDLDVDLEYQSLALAAVYGVTDRLDIGAVIPVVDAEMDVKADARVIHSPLNTTPELHTFEGPGAESAKDFASESATGIGDILLGAKYYGISRQSFDLAGAFEVKLDTGDEDNFLGTGDINLFPAVIVSADVSEFFTTYLNLGPDFNVNTHLNLGYDVNVSDSDKNAVEYAAGVELGTSQLTGVVDILGSHETSGDGIGENIVDAAFGARWRPQKNIVLTGNFLIPVNDEGLRSDLISTVAIEYRN